MAHELSLEILQCIRQFGPITRAEIARKFDISQSLVSRLVSELVELGLVQEIGSADSTSGRPASRLTLNPQAGYAIGLDVGGRRRIAVITNLAGEVVSDFGDSPPFSAERPLTPSNMEDAIHRIIQAADIPTSLILGLGVGFHDIVDPVAGVTYGWPHSPEWSSTWINYPLRDALASILPFPHILVDDVVRGLGIAEARYGRGIHEPNFVYVLADLGIGMAIMLDGKPYIGASHVAGEISHVPVGNQPGECLCGNQSCLGTLAGIDAVILKVKQRLADSPIHSGLRMLDHITFEDILDASQNGDKLSTQVLMEAGEFMGMALAIVLNLFGPGLVILGGGLAHSPVYLEAARRLMRLRSLEMAARGVELVASTLDELAGARGAATLVLDALFAPGEKNLVRLAEQRLQRQDARERRC